ncbi:F-actin-capping protein subunit alpha-like [Varroa jacobsoni]|uniref:F-actin-capping protein subunit alpha n=1 Tax=Varroa destructor TaxID=109461 RepID=A0A7M7JUL6_VARDE|nr:F-actin-capping protein subunit alpha-like [Varroa destructor]XP_022702593.1 F-actin-capping protein subunit alpha-like [Varroa jacobsoni]
MDDASDNDKVRIISSFMSLSPPGEFNEVFNDCRALVGNHELLSKAAANTISDYHMDQLTPCSVDGLSHKSLITHYNQLPDGRYYDPRGGVSFRFDHYKRETTDPQPMSPTSSPDSEALRAALDAAWGAYCIEHYRHGVAAVFDQSENNNQQSRQYIMCIEDHQFQSHNYWNGRWRGVWTLTCESGATRASLLGAVKVQVHYYEDGNVQLQANKEHQLSIPIENDCAVFAQAVVHAVRDAEASYQSSINENYKSMNDKTFKALRRHLPLTRSKIDWQKILSYRVASEISTKQQ